MLNPLTARPREAYADSGAPKMKSGYTMPRCIIWNLKDIQSIYTLRFQWLTWVVCNVIYPKNQAIILHVKLSDLTAI